MDASDIAALPRIAENPARATADAREDQAKRLARLDAFEQSHSMAEFDLDGALVWANQQFVEIMGWRLEEVVGKPHAFFVSDEVAASPEYHDFWATLRDGALRTAEVRRIARDGSTRWLRASYAPIRDEAGVITGVASIAADVTEERREAAQHGAKIAALGHSHAVIEFDLAGNIVNANDNFLALLGYEKPEIVGRHHSIFVSDAEAESAEYRKFWTDLASGAFKLGRFRRLGKGGRPLWIEGAYSVILNADDEPVGVYKIARDVTGEVETRAELERRRLEYTANLRRAKTEVERQTLTDPLTGLANRRRLDQELERRLRDGDVVLVSVDLDRFKQINDVLGHEAGDHVLRHVAKTMTEQTRGADLVARVGGDEFVVLFSPETSEAVAVSVAERMLDALLQPVEFKKKRCMFGASFGVATCEAGSVGASEILSYADAALYKAKRTGRQKVEIFTPQLKESVSRDRRLADEFVAALETAQIEPHVQTVHHAEDWSVAGIEVLARWRHPEHGLLAPDGFLHIARQLGMEAELDQKILDAALAELSTLEARGVRVPRVSFNVSASRILAPDFAETLARRIDEDRDRFAFEITETVSYPEHETELAFAVDALRELGFRVDIDDFGMGYASINSLLAITPNAIKIDREIVKPLGQNPRNEKMIALIVEIARVMEVGVTATGVETRDQAEMLRDCGCDALQGFFFSKPMPIAELEPFLRRSGAETG